MAFFRRRSSFSSTTTEQRENGREKKSSQLYQFRASRFRTWSRDAEALTATARRGVTARVVRPARASAAGRRVTAAERAMIRS